MAGGKVVTAVRSAVEPTVESLGYELVDVEYVKEGPNRYLRLYIDKRGGISIDDCVAVNDAAGPLIDELDPIEEAYVFEVSSPGLDRPLRTDRDFARYAGEDVDISLYSAVDGKKQFSGKLLGKTDIFISIEDEKGERRDFDSKAVASVKRSIKF